MNISSPSSFSWELVANSIINPHQVMQFLPDWSISSSFFFFFSCFGCGLQGVFDVPHFFSIIYFSLHLFYLCYSGFTMMGLTSFWKISQSLSLNIASSSLYTFSLPGALIKRVDLLKQSSHLSFIIFYYTSALDWSSLILSSAVTHLLFK